ncbi:hypothetical protein N658DRAFT_488132 [Parathielavia hyrcaniae]|uniref:Uncharacterized protein n=1 Tax=Parathielavia hyrcaniae TaxID=113614 RepID=A0AAN6Q0H1_9PEZI|nr:hypothetical protein N658DRAFT_488132 [Parathielavia hyrcaniae]
MRASVLATLLAFSGPASCVEFISPPPPSPNTSGNLGANPVYAFGSAIEAAWTDTGDTGIPFSVVVHQVDTSTGAIPSDQRFEYVVHNAVNLTNTHWVVATAKNLTFSNVFVLSVFFQGDTVGRALSQFFNISSQSTDRPTQTVTVTATAAATATATFSNTAEAAATSDDGFGTAAKVGLVVGIVAALGLGVLVGWLLSRCFTKRAGFASPPLSEPATGMTGGSVAGPAGGYYTAGESGLGLGADAAGSGKWAGPRELDGAGSLRHELGGT